MKKVVKWYKVGTEFVKYEKMKTLWRRIEKYTILLQVTRIT